jgi:L-iditol 2-dehydrogenase
MKAAVLHGKEDLRIEEVSLGGPGPGEVLIRVGAALTCGTDVKVFRRGYHARMLVPPIVFGHEVAGTIVEVGEGVDAFSPGMPVVAANSAPCGACEYCRAGRASLCDDLLFWNGAYAEYAVIPARIVACNLLPLPAGFSFAKAALVEPLACVVRGAAESGIVAGQTVAVIGVGPIGLMFVALARARGARVIAAGRRPDRLARACALGAETVAVTPGSDLAQLLRDAGRDGRGPDVVIEAVGMPETSEAAIRAARKGGHVNLFGGCPSGSVIRVDAQRWHYEELTIRATFHHTPESIREALRLIVSGAVDGDGFISGETRLDGLPEILRTQASQGNGLKVAVIP